MKLSSSPKTGVKDEIDAFIGQTVREIDVQGLKRIGKDAILAKFSTHVGTAVDRELLRADVQAIFNLGYFEDIAIAAETLSTGVKLTVTLKERPVITDIEFIGNERISTEDLEGVIKVKKWSILDVNKVNEDVGLITKHYEDKGYYLAKTKFEVVQPDAKNKPDEVVLRYKINDYDKVQIKKITFLNNKNFTDDQLKKVFAETQEGGFWSFMSNSGNFKESGFKVDLQRLTYWYLDNGFVKFKYENPVVTISDDKKWLYVTIYVDEGDKFNVGKIDFSGDLLFSREELGTDLNLNSKDLFAITKRNQDIQKLSEKYQDLGYAFVNVVPKMDVKDDTKTVDIDYSFEKGSLAYFGEINTVGNAKTHDKVIRRELKIKEGELYNGTRFRESKENVERLGFFQPNEVLFNTTTPKGRNDIVNVEIAVKERPTGTITLGAGYGSVRGLFFTTTISESNFRGKGQNLSLATNITRDRRDKSLTLGFTDPYAFDTEWSAGFDVFYSTFVIPGRFTNRKIGLNLKLGHPITDYTNAYITYKREKNSVESIDIESPDALDESLINADVGLLSSVVWSVVRDRRNNRFETSAGSYQSISLETAGIGGDKAFTKVGLNNRFYKRLFGDLVFRNNFEYGQAVGRNERGVPPSDRFYLGGPNNLRGYNFFTVGPFREKQVGSLTERIPLGGRYQFIGMFEIEQPIIREAGLKFVTFYDIGNVWDSLPQFGEISLRQDYGFGFRWFSPIGPLRFEWGFPVSPKPGDDNSVFSFFIGPPF